MVLKYKQDKHMLAGFGPHKYINYSRKHGCVFETLPSGTLGSPPSNQPAATPLSDLRFCSHLPVKKFFKRSRAAPDARGPICLPGVGEALLHATVSVQ